MCGLCGVAGQGIISRDLEIFYDLLWVTGLRGHHSTGVFGYHPFRPKRHRFELTKRVQPSSSFVLQDQGTKAGYEVVGSINARLYMGHCRFATVGSVTANNAHPFDTGRYVSAHNGTLKDKKYKDKDKTDSQMMFEDMESRGVESVLNDLDFMSAFAVSIFDKTTKKLTLGTNGDRPLWMAVAKNRSVFYYASEKAALDFVSVRRNTDMIFMKCEPYKLYTLDCNSVDQGTNENFEIVELKRPKMPAQSSKEFDWSVLEWPPKGSPSEAYCCACGTLLYGKDKDEADQYPFGGTIYYTCRSCGSQGVEKDEEVKVG